MKNNSNPVRKGSIPMVLIVVVCLGIVAGAAIFNTGNSARLDKKSELNQAAWIIAQAAVEETIVKCSNGTAAPVEKARQSFPANATLATLGNSKDVQIEPVELVSRIIEDKKKVTPAQAAKQAEAEHEIRMLAALVPGFFKKENPKGTAYLQGELANFQDAKNVGNGVKMNYDVDWRRKMQQHQAKSTGATTNFDPLMMKAIEIAYAYQEPGKPEVTKVMAADFDKTKLSGKAAEYFHQNVEQGGNAESDTNNNPKHEAALTKFTALEPLTYLGPFNAATINTVQHSTTELDAFKKQYAEATESLADHMQSRINGCNGDFNYAIGGMLTGLARGAPGANDSETCEEVYRDQSEESGLTEYKEGLLSVSTKVRFTRGSVSAEQQYTAHRIMRQMNLNTIMVDVGKSMLGYLHGYYNLTRADLIYLGFLGKPEKKSDTNPDGLPSAATAADLSAPDYVPTATANMFMVMNERFNVYSGNTQVRNAQLANCLGAPK